MTTLIKTYPTETKARRAIEALRATDVPAHHIRLLIGRRPGDLRSEPAGGFAGPVGPEARVGTFGDRNVLRRQGRGSFAGDADRQRQGSFADTDRVVIVTYSGDAERARITGLRGARRLLRRAALDDGAVDRAVGELHEGRTVMLVDVRGVAASDAVARLEQLTRAA
jgi:hypothetical protein